MDIEEFEKQVPPKAKRSRLEPFAAQIFALKAKGYTNEQVRDWLASNSEKVSVEGVRKFIKSRENDQPAATGVSTGAPPTPTPPKAAAKPAPAAPVTMPERINPTAANVGDNSSAGNTPVVGEDAKKARDERIEKFVPSKPGPSDRMKKLID